MLFDSVQFLLFLPAVIALYFILPHRLRWIFLLVSSYYFYGCWKAEFLVLLLYSTFNAYFISLRIEQAASLFTRRAWLITGLVSNFSVLFFFKYFNFFIGSRDYFKTFAGQHPKVEWVTQVLEYGIPVGISFFTFQAVGYTLDIYFRQAKAEKNFFKFALFVSYFPQLVAGPIERFTHLHQQLFAKHKLVYENLSNGFRLILYGLFIKMVIADNLAPLADPVFTNPLAYSQTDTILALLFFSLQIYADFHGYSLIAIGVAGIMGIKLMDNFKTPYLAVSVKEFWARWHISLSTWFRDYLYVPLGGNKVSYFRWMVNIMIIFLVSGIWHGANYTFIVWGALHGFMYLAEQVFVRAGWLQTKNRFFTGIGFVKTFLVINIAWLFFRSDTLAKAYLSLAKIFGSEPTADLYYRIQHFEHGKANQAVDDAFLNGKLVPAELTLHNSLFIGLAILIVTELWIQKSRFDQRISTWNFGFRWLVYAVLIYCVMALSGPDFYQFIYFQF
ncbi:MAG: MBOAT family protein [Bacteroidetes bacterium]|nr:MBOAT family protein [Bacteroidota bacterium]